MTKKLFKNTIGSLVLLALTGIVLIGCGNDDDTDLSVDNGADVEFKKDADAGVNEKNDLKKEQDVQVESSSDGATLDDLVEGEAEVMESDPDYQGGQDPVISDETDQNDALLQELVEQEAKDPSLNKTDPTK